MDWTNKESFFVFRHGQKIFRHVPNDTGVNPNSLSVNELQTGRDAGG